MIYTTKYPYDKLVHTTVIKFKIKLKLNCFFFHSKNVKINITKLQRILENFKHFHCTYLSYKRLVLLALIIDKHVPDHKR